MRVLCVSHHAGALASMKSMFAAIGWEIKLFYARPDIPYKVTHEMADAIWEAYEAEWNTYDLVMTADAASLAFLFMKNLYRMKPKLICWIMNRFDYGQEDIPGYREFFRATMENEAYKNKFRVVPYTEYEKIYAAARGIYIKEQVLLPHGKKLDPIPNDPFGKKDHSGMIDKKEETVYITYYGNDNLVVPFVEMLKEAKISVASEQFLNIEEIQDYKCVVHMPDAFSKFCAFEFLVGGLPMFIPTERFFQAMNVCARRQPDGNFEIYRFTVDGNICPQQYVPLCEWYRYPNSKIYFDSFEDLIQKLREFTPEKRRKLRQQQARDADFHMNYVMLTFKKLISDLFMA
jgi:hypothetical protein